MAGEGFDPSFVMATDPTGVQRKVALDGITDPLARQRYIDTYGAPQLDVPPAPGNGMADPSVHYGTPTPVAAAMPDVAPAPMPADIMTPEKWRSMSPEERRASFAQPAM